MINKFILIALLFIGTLTSCKRQEEKRKLLSEYSGTYYYVIKNVSVYDRPKDGKYLGYIRIGEKVTITDVDIYGTDNEEVYVRVQPTRQYVVSGWILANTISKNKRKLYVETNNFKNDIMNTLKNVDVTTNVIINIDNKYVTIKIGDSGKLECFVDPLDGKDCLLSDGFRELEDASKEAIISFSTQGAGFTCVLRRDDMKIEDTQDGGISLNFPCGQPL